MCRRRAILFLVAVMVLSAVLFFPGHAHKTHLAIQSHTPQAMGDTTFLTRESKHILLSRQYNLPLGSKRNRVQYFFKNIDTTKVDLIVELTNPFLHQVSFYITGPQPSDSTITGALFNFNQRPLIHPNFQCPLTLSPGETVSWVADIDVGTVSGDFRLLAWTRDGRNAYQVSETKYLSSFFIINISFLFLIGIAILLTRQRYHWYFFIYALFGFLYIYAEVGLGFKNLWPEDPAFQNASILLIANIYQLFGLLFIRKYFNTSAKTILFDRILIGLAFSALFFEMLIGAMMLLNKTLPVFLVEVNTVQFILSGLCVFGVAGLSLRQKTLKSDAIWFIIGFTPHAISILQLCLRPFGVINAETFFKAIAPVYIETIHPPNFLLWSVLWESVIVFWLIIKRLKRLYEENSMMIEKLAIQKEKNMRTLLTGVENERQRIAQELHDGSGVALSALKMRLHVLKDAIADEKKDNINGLMKEVDRIYEDIRNISHNLMPKTLSKLGLYPAIEELVGQFRTAVPQIRFNYYRKITSNHFGENAKINIFRMIQELLTNVVKHADAREVSLQLITHNNALMISVEDDGKGFNLRETKNGVGLTSVESRVQMLNGTLSIDTSPENGTFISIFLPLSSLN